MSEIAVYFRWIEDESIYEVIEDSSDWANAPYLPSIGEDVYLGGCGKSYWWYTVKAIRWFDSKSVTLVVHNKRDRVEE